MERTMKREEVKRAAQVEGKGLFIIDQDVIDFSTFEDFHPGGAQVRGPRMQAPAIFHAAWETLSLRSTCIFTRIPHSIGDTESKIFVYTSSTRRREA
jgi:hypothetical protein